MWFCGSQENVAMWHGDSGREPPEPIASASLGRQHLDLLAQYSQVIRSERWNLKKFIH